MSTEPKFIAWRKILKETDPRVIFIKKKLMKAKRKTKNKQEVHSHLRLRRGVGRIMIKFHYDFIQKKREIILAFKVREL
jgi:hypothetical protein